MPKEELLDIREVRLDLPPKARIFPSVVCASCGEAAMEPRVRMRDGKPVCIPCADSYAAPPAGGR
ncbi:TraR/DksA C4-type zinc finger protein [Desulforudis sp. DRI-14]|uniref:TraR/DksA C4-type zinc finger protein n=1 Tax=Desulforudis sp. DRI-14 TaxID=3459793 RepID=UPI004042E6BB